MGRAEKRRIERKARIEKRKGVPMSLRDIDRMHDDTVEEVSNYNVETLMTCFALAEHELYGFGRKRVIRTLKFVEEIMGPISDGSVSIESYKKKLENDVGVVIKC